MGKLSKENKDGGQNVLDKGWRMIDDYTGMYRYSSELVQDYQGYWTLPEYANSKHPQEFPLPPSRERPLPYSRPQVTDIELAEPLQDEDIV